MKYLSLLLAALLLLAGPALADSSLTLCTSSEITNAIVGAGECAAWRFNQDDEDSPGITMRTATGTICFDPNTGAAGADTAEIMLWRCPNGIKPSSNYGFTCLEILDAPLDGTVGADGTQNACKRVTTGTYFSEVTTPDAGVSSVVYFQSEGN